MEGEVAGRSCRRLHQHIGGSGRPKATTAAHRLTPRKLVPPFPRTARCSFCRISFFASVVARQTSRSNIIAYPGYCHVHKTIQPEQVVEILDQHPDIELFIRNAWWSCMAKAVQLLDVSAHRTFFLPPRECSAT